MKRMIIAAAIALTAWPAPALAAAPELSGAYRLAGWNPGSAPAGRPNYAGSLALKGSGRVYEAVWVIGSSVTKGRGLLKAVGDRWVLSIGYATAEGASIAVYDVVAGAGGLRLVGEWVGNGLGREVAEPMRSDGASGAEPPAPPMTEEL